MEYGRNLANTKRKQMLKVSMPPSNKNAVACPKCGCKRRHARGCQFKKKGEEEEELDVAALKRYKRHYRLKTKHNSTKAELANAVTMHFENLNVDEVEVIEVFVMKIKNGLSSSSSP